MLRWIPPGCFFLSQPPGDPHPGALLSSSWPAGVMTNKPVAGRHLCWTCCRSVCRIGTGSPPPFFTPCSVIFCVPSSCLSLSQRKYKPSWQTYPYFLILTVRRVVDLILKVFSTLIKMKAKQKKMLKNNKYQIHLCVCADNRCFLSGKIRLCDQMHFGTKIILRSGFQKLRDLNIMTMRLWTYINKIPEKT